MSMPVCLCMPARCMHVYECISYKPGQSVRGVFRREKWLSKVPAHASLFVRKFEFRLNSFFTVAGIDECSKCECGVGPLGSWITAQGKKSTATTTTASTSKMQKIINLNTPTQFLTRPKLRTHFSYKEEQSFTS